MDTRAQHLTLDIWLSATLEDAHLEHIRRVVRSELTVLKTAQHQFEPHGLTEVFILSESHFTVHTYPEHNYLSLDCYVCNPQIDLEALAARLLGCLPVGRIAKRVQDRGGPPPLL